MSTSDLCDFCLCVCLAEPHVGGSFLFLVQPLSHNSGRAIPRNISLGPVRETDSRQCVSLRELCLTSFKIMNCGGETGKWEGGSSQVSVIAVDRELGFGNHGDRGCMRYFSTQPHAGQ